jgi:hypothetical protein
MKRIQTLSLILLATVLFAGCKKATFDTEVKGEALGTFRITAPASNTTIALNSATPNAPIVFSWTASKPGVNTQPNYRVVFSLRTGSIDNPIMELASDNAGKATQLTITQKQLDDLLAFRNIPTNTPVDMIWSVVANNGTTKQRSDDVFNITLRRMGNGASPFILLAPVYSTTPVAIDPGSTTNNMVFKWTKSIPGAGSPAVKYTVLFAERRLDANGNELPINWSTPLFQITSDNNGADTTLTATYKRLSDSLTAKGFTNLGAPTMLKWTVIANSGTWNQKSDYENVLGILREVRLYMPGSYQAAQGLGNDWDPPTAPEMIRDLRPGLINNMYYAYMYFAAGTQFKITEGRSWAVNYGPATNTAGIGTGTLTPNSGNNFTITTSGVYRISINRTTLQYDISLGRMGFVGDAATGVGWNPPGAFPTSQMAFPYKNVFVGIYNFQTGPWKMIDKDQWNNGSNAVDETRSYGSNGPSGSTMDINGPNFPNITTAGRYRVIWDGRDVNNIKYLLEPATEMRIVGDGIQGVNPWDPGTSPQMTYMGNGVWQITVTLIANKDIKFVAGNAWGAFDYEDASGGSQATGTPRVMAWDGGPNFKTPATTGSYTITLNEYNQTVTIN